MEDNREPSLSLVSFKHITSSCTNYSSAAWLLISGRSIRQRRWPVRFQPSRKAYCFRTRSKLATTLHFVCHHCAVTRAIRSLALLIWKFACLTDTNKNKTLRENLTWEYR